MMKRTLAGKVLAASLAVSACSAAHAQAVTKGDAQFSQLADQYFDQVYFPFSPTMGTAAGFHQYDPKLEDYSRAGIDREIAALHAFLPKVEHVSPASLSQTERGDREMILGNIHSTLLTLETIKPWEKNPDFYSSSVTNSIFTLMERTFASPDERMESAVARERQIPMALKNARVNLQNPPKIYTQIALQQLPGVIAFYQNDVPAAFAKATDPAIKSDFAKSNAAVIDALQQYQVWLQTDLLRKSNGDFRIGAETYAKKLSYDEMVDTPLDKLLEIAYADLHKNQADFVRIAHEVDPNKTPLEVLDELGNDHPAPDHLLASFRDTFNGLITFIRAKQIITIPSDIRPILEETPPFERATTFASMDTPGAYEKKATEAYFNVTLPDPSWDAARTNSYMHSFNIGTIVSTSVHEAYPGHYVQFLWIPEAPSKTRKLLFSATNVEGWAHYCEQMMLDQGFDQLGAPGSMVKDEREAKMIRLGQLQDALLRDARFVVGIKMHTGKMTMDQAIDFFVKEGYQAKEVGEVETKRGTADPTYLYYTLGKLQIMKLRADVQAKQGAAFSLKEFHDNFMRQGGVPIKIMRESMLGDNSPTL
jgi:uncharacterized protein (DUF885 family)